MKDTIVDILLVEDNPNDAELAIHALKRHRLANRLHWVKDGVEALDYIFFRDTYSDRNPELPRVILLDLRLPKLDGIQVLTEIRSNEKTRDIPVVVLTSSKEDKDLVNTYRLGINSFVPKPVIFNDFIHVVSDLGLYWVLVNRVPPQIRAD
ncbi:MAG: response regulator [Candidatus Thiodiazotropha sp. 6PLUC2]